MAYGSASVLPCGYTVWMCGPLMSTPPRTSAALTCPWYLQSSLVQIDWFTEVCMLMPEKCLAEHFAGCGDTRLPAGCHSVEVKLSADHICDTSVRFEAATAPQHSRCSSTCGLLSVGCCSSTAAVNVGCDVMDLLAVLVANLSHTNLNRCIQIVRRHTRGNAPLNRQLPVCLHQARHRPDTRMLSFDVN